MTGYPLPRAVPDFRMTFPRGDVAADGKADIGARLDPGPRAGPPHFGVIAWGGRMLVFEHSAQGLTARFLGDEWMIDISSELAAAIARDVAHQREKAGR